jgi:hypothetical protein
MMMTNYAADYKGFLEHIIVVADRFEINLSESAQRILKEEYPIFIKAMEAGGKTFSDIEEDAKNTWLFKENERFYRANGIERTWLDNTIE